MTEDRLRLVQSPFTTSGQETNQVYYLKNSIIQPARGTDDDDDDDDDNDDGKTHRCQQVITQPDG